MDGIPIASLAWFATCMFMFPIDHRPSVRAATDTNEKRSKTPLGASGIGRVGDPAEAVARPEGNSVIRGSAQVADWATGHFGGGKSAIPPLP